MTRRLRRSGPTELDPLSLIARTVQASILYSARRYDEALTAAARVTDMDRNFPKPMSS